MKRIFMHSTEFMATSKGPQRLEKGSVYEVEDWIAASVVGRGMAHEVNEENKASRPSADYDDMTVAKLREEAKSLGITGYMKMKKEELLAAVMEHVVSLTDNVVVAEPPPEPFEQKPLTGGQQPPEFKRQ